MSGQFRTCPHCQRLTLNQRCDNPDCTGPGTRVTLPVDPLRWHGSISFDPVPVDFAKEERAMDQFRRKGGRILDADGRVIGVAGPADTPDPDEPWVMTAPVRPPKAADITDEAFCAALNPDGEWTQWGEMVTRLKFPDKVVLAKARILIDRRRTVHGCPCGCSGGWHRADECKGC